MALSSQTKKPPNDGTAEILQALRGNWTQGQVARRLGVSSAVIHNLEHMKSRTPLDFFAKLLELKGHTLGALVQKHSSSLGQIDTTSIAALFMSYRKRLKLSQRNFAKKLGYSSAAMVHHFEKGIRMPCLSDLMRLMREAQDDCYSFVLDVTGNPFLAARFPRGNLAQTPETDEYWNHFYISAIRQLIRTSRYRDKQNHHNETFEKALSLTPDEVKYALGVLTRLGIVEWKQNKYAANPKFKLMKPQRHSEEKITNIKKQWLNYHVKAFNQASHASQSEHRKATQNFLTVDSLPMNQEIFERMILLIRAFQDELHRLPLKDTTGLGSVVILARLQELEA